MCFNFTLNTLNRSQHDSKWKWNEVWGGKGKLESSPGVLNIILNDKIKKKPHYSVFLIIFSNNLRGSWVVISWIASDPFGLDKIPLQISGKLRCSQKFGYFFLCLLPFLPSLLTHFSVYLFSLQASVGLPGKCSKKTLLQLSFLLSNVVLGVMAKASFTYRTADPSVAGWGKKSHIETNRWHCDKEKSEEQEIF